MALFYCSKCGLKQGPDSAQRSAKHVKFCLNKRNRFAKMCVRQEVHTFSTPSSPADNWARNTRSDGSMDTELIFGELKTKTVDGRAWYSKVKVGGELIDIKLDTGANANIIARQIYDYLLLLRGKWRNPTRYCHRVGTTSPPVSLGKVTLMQLQGVGKNSQFYFLSCLCGICSYS